jgi:hypothetical protein
MASPTGSNGAWIIGLRRLVFRRLVLMSLTAFSWSVYPAIAKAADKMTVDEVGKLEPELCQEGSYRFRVLTGALPGLAGSSTRDMAPERIALIDQLKVSGRRKVWVLNIPAAFITFRTCDAGRKNWTGEDEELKVSQIYNLDLLLLGGRAIPKTRATSEDKISGVAVRITLENFVTDPQRLSQIYLGKSWVLGRHAASGRPTCQEQLSDISGLVAFKRINPNVRSFDDCGEQQNGVYAKKNADGRYDFVMYCQVDCRVYRDYEGWSVQYAYDFRWLTKWESIHGQIRKLFDEWTIHIDHDS